MNNLTFDDDLLGGFKDFADRLENFILVESQFVQGGLVIGLSSNFGTGKNTFFDMWKASINKCEDGEQRFHVVSLNAWESDYFGDPLFAIVSALIESMKKNDESTTKLIEAAKDFGWFVTALGSQIASNVAGVDPIAAGEYAEQKKGERNQLVPDSFSVYQQRKNSMHALKKAISDYVANTKPKIIFLVDELDRCRPDYAISYLETIKHIFDLNDVVFVLAADRDQLENSARTAFGQKLNFDQYYRKFIHREIKLPQIQQGGYRKIADKYVKRYLIVDNIRECVLELNSARFDDIVELMSALKLTPRQIQEIFRILGHILETTSDNRGQLYWCIGLGTILMSVLKIGKSDIYKLLGTQQLPLDSALSFFKSVSGRNSELMDWLYLCHTGGGIVLLNGESIEDGFFRLNLIATKEKFQSDAINAFRRGWGSRSSSDSRFSQIYQKIEELDKWKGSRLAEVIC